MVYKARENMCACEYMYFCIPLWLHSVLQFIGTPKKKKKESWLAIIFFFLQFQQATILFFSPLHFWQLNYHNSFFFFFSLLHIFGNSVALVLFYPSPLPYNFSNSIVIILFFFFFSLFFDTLLIWAACILGRNLGNYITEIQLSLSPSVTPFLSSLSYFFLEFRQHY